MLLYLIHVQNENFEDYSRIVARKVANHVQLNEKKNAGKILQMGLLKYTFDNKILTSESNAVQRGKFVFKILLPIKNTNYKLTDFFLHI